MNQTTPGTTTAVVIGASIAGLCAARVLADHCEHVVVIEADELDAEGAGARKGVPQARYLHALLQGGEQALEELFPGLGARLTQYGALRFDLTERVAFLRPGGWAPPMSSGVETFCCSRPMTERVVRELFHEQVQATVLDGHKAVGLCVQGDGSRPPLITGVKLRGRDGEESILDAQLVVDASGRGSRTPRWLAEMGLDPVPTEEIDGHVTYATRWYEAPPREQRPASWWWDALWIDPLPNSEPTLALLSPSEDGKWTVAMSRYAHGRPPRDAEEFHRQLRSLRTPLLADALELATPISDVHVTRSTGNRRRFFERGEPRVQGLLVIGDAACALNPVYGQGMTVAAQSGVALAKVLREVGPRDPRLTARFFRSQARVVELPWAMSTGVDLQFETTDGNRSRFGKLFNPFFEAVMSAAYVTPAVARQVMPLLHLAAGPSVLLRPSLLAQVGAHHLRSRAGTGPQLHPTACAASRAWEPGNLPLSTGAAPP